MGLLTDPKSREKVVALVSRHCNKLCVLCYIVGLIWFIALAYKPFNAATYFSENALLPGLVEQDFHHDFGAADFHQSLKSELKALKADDKNREKLNKMPSTWMEAQLRSIGLDTYVQNYSFMYPSGILKNQVFHGQNVYGIMRAPRAASTEALVLSAPYRPPDSELDRTNAGIALMLGLARAFKRHTYWAKDIIFLVTEHELIGMQAWLNAYHDDTQSQYIAAGELHGRSGSIQAAINLELGTESISRMNIKLEGLNGQLPNLDLVNTAVRLIRREGMLPTLQKRGDYWNEETIQGFEHSMQTMFLMMWNQAPGTPTGNHGLFHRYNIEAITLQGVKMKNAKKTFSFVETGQVLEGIFRALNNLLERFHQSFFFYLLPATERYVSIGLYMPPFGIMAAPIIFKAIALWISFLYSGEQEDEKEEITDKKQDGDKQKEKEQGQGESEHKTDTSADTTENKTIEGGESEKDENKTEHDEKKRKSQSALMSVSPWLIMAALFGLTAYRGPKFTIESAAPFHLPPGEGLAWGALALLLSALIFPFLLQRKARQKGNSTGANAYMLKCIGLLLLGVVMVAMSLLNISLAFFITAAWVPMFLMVWPQKNRVLAWLQYLLLLLFSPLGMLYLCCVGQTLATTTASKWPSVGELYSGAWVRLQGALLHGIVEGSLHGNWTFTVASLVLLPTWLVFWSLQWAQIEP